MDRYAFRIAYIGAHFNGFQKQPSGTAIENFLEKAFVKSQYIQSFSKNNYRAMSRTDANVNALCNIMSVDIDKNPSIDRLNSFLPKSNTIFLYDFAKVDPSFNPRKVGSKTYQYTLYNPSSHVLNKLSRIYQFIGQYDFSPFIKPDGAGEHDPISSIYDIDLERERSNQQKNEVIKIKIKGDKFGREQIRRMMGFLLDDRFFSFDVLDVLENTITLPNFVPAPGEFLCLHDISYPDDLKWENSSSDYLREMVRRKADSCQNNLWKNIERLEIFESIHRYLLEK